MRDCQLRWPFGEPGVGLLIEAHTREEHPETWAIWQVAKEIDQTGRGRLRLI